MNHRFAALFARQATGMLLIGVLITVLSTIAAWSASPGDVVFSEVLWMGSTLSSRDEWIELRNTTGEDIDLSGWNITRKVDETFMLEIPEGIIPAGGYFLISNYDAENSRINVTPDLVTSAVSLDNSQLMLRLYDGAWDEGGALIDTADDGVGAPAAGDKDLKYSMVRNDIPGDGTQSENWHTAAISIGWDVGVTERGTPGSGDNSLPVTLSSFTSTVVEDGVTLKWVTESEVSNLGFYVYRSKDGVKYLKISPRIKGAGTASGRNQYEFRDDNGIAGYRYYIEDVDFQGNRNKSDVIKVGTSSAIQPRKHKVATMWVSLKVKW